jgi:hypothetical protein
VSFCNRRYSLAPHCGQTYSTICKWGQERGLCPKAAMRSIWAWQDVHCIAGGMWGLVGRVPCRQEDDEEDAEVRESESDGGERFRSAGLVWVLLGLG